jgi:hypothetical protein
MAEQRRCERSVRGGGSLNRRRYRASILIARSLRIAGVVGALALLACDDVSARLGPGINIGTGGSGSGRHALVGLWTRVVVLTDNFGDTHSSRTTWEFRSDGSATRTVVAQNLSLGVSDVIIARATWRTEGSTLVITFQPPDAGTSRFFFAIFSDVLTLDGRDFVRIG